MTNNDILKKQMVSALEQSLGIVSKACEAVGISRNTHYRWCIEDEAYKAETDGIQDLALDHVESKLFEKINGIKIQTGENVYDVPPSDTAIIFYLKTKGKKRGYVEKQEIEVNANPDIFKIIPPDGL